MRIRSGLTGNGYGLASTAAASGDSWKVEPISGEVFQFNLTDRAWMNAQCTSHPIASLEERIRLSGALERIQKVTHILATGFREGSPFPVAQARAKKRDWKTTTVTCGHDVMLDMPEELTTLLLDHARDLLV
jgi:hypothetical protein